MGDRSGGGVRVAVGGTTVWGEGRAQSGAMTESSNAVTGSHPSSGTASVPVEAGPYAAPLAEGHGRKRITLLVHPNLPEALERGGLGALAGNLWWVWNPGAVSLFRRIDSDLFDQLHQNPVALLSLADPGRLEVLSRDSEYLADLRREYEAFKGHIGMPCTWTPANPTLAETGQAGIAYFSAEFGLHESLPIYSGGLGVLAGDHLKSASEIGLPLLAVGLFYRNGYFTQYLAPDGWQKERYPELDPDLLPVKAVIGAEGKPLRVSVDVGDNKVYIAVWRVSVGRVPLYLMDTQLPENAPADREITAKLYGTGDNLRIRQEIVLGIGGVRVLEALGLRPKVFHMNEGHSAFLALERVRNLLAAQPELSFDQARQFVAATSVFTTHTPVPAGIDRFPPDTMVKFFANYWEGLKLDEDGFLALGRENVYDKQQSFSMAVLAIRLADSVNGVSKLHGEESRMMWKGIWPGVPEAEVPIGSVTNGVHLRTWLSPEISNLLMQYAGHSSVSVGGVKEVTPATIANVPDSELWRAHEHSRQELVTFVRKQLKRNLIERHNPLDDVGIADNVLDPSALTIGFARRFATYKRATLLLSDPGRLARLLGDDQRPIQFIFAGKAHPADNEGKEFIRTLVNYVKDPVIRRRFVFLENYDMNVARHMVQGADVWLNTPRRPYEASGTSGMKAAANGVLNCSVLDGWWVEGYTPEVGWAIGAGEELSDGARQDAHDAASLYALLENEIIPLFYSRRAPSGAASGAALPSAWVTKMKASISQLSMVYNTNRMVGEYAKTYYIPASVRGARLSAGKLAGASRLAALKDRLRAKWPAVSVLGMTVGQPSGPSVAAPGGEGANAVPAFRVGESVRVQAIVDLGVSTEPPGIEGGATGGLLPSEVTVQLYGGRTDSAGSFVSPQILKMEQTEKLSSNRYVFAVDLPCKMSGRLSYTVRVLPAESDLATPFEPGLISWAAV